jgi:hypothetical protein
LIRTAGLGDIRSEDESNNGVQEINKIGPKDGSSQRGIAEAAVSEVWLLRVAVSEM